MSRKIEESPILSLNDCDLFIDSWKRYWICYEELSELFDIDDAESLCLVAKSRGDKSTYKIKLKETASPSYPDLLKPIECNLWRCLAEWLKTQVDAGRPHIGVRIIK